MCAWLCCSRQKPRRRPHRVRARAFVTIETPAKSEVLDPVYPLPSLPSRNKPLPDRKLPNNWDSATCLTHSADKDQRLTLESWFTSNIIYCITCTLCNKLYIGESGRKLGDRFREHLLDVKNKGSDLSKPVARHFNLPDHSHEHMEICRIYLHLGNNETRKRKEQRLIFKLGTLAPNGINERFSFA